MTREIKFRAWDGEKIQEEFNLTDDGQIFSIYSERLDGHRRDFKKDWILMQFTGLKDKNGKEIYEGDIIQNKSGVGFIEYDEKNAVWLFGKHRYSKDYIFEIIGNIYENNELLTNPAQ